MKSTVLIVGAGVLGCSMAYELTRHGAAVTVLDSGEILSGASAATYGWVNANNKTPIAYEHLNVLGMQAHERARQAQALGAGPWFHQIGNIEIASTDEEMAAVEAKVGRLASRGYDASLLSRHQVRELEPALGPAGLEGGAWYPKEGWIDTVAMCSNLLQAASDSGAHFIPFQRVTKVEPTGQVTATATDGSVRQYSADVTILAAGNGNRSILATAGIDFPTQDSFEDGTAEGGPNRPTVGLISTTGPVDSGIRHVVHANGIAIRPARNGGVMFTDSSTGGKWHIDDPRIWTVPNVLLDRARQLYPSLKDATTENVVLGTRVLPKDGVTIADWISSEHSVYAIATHSGVTLAAHLAQAVTAEVLHGQRHDSLIPFGLTRFTS